MTNAEFYENIRRLAGDKGLTLYQLYKKCDGIPESTFFAMFQRKSTPKLEYISIFSRALNISQGELLEPENKSDMLTPVQMELIEAVADQDERMIRRIIPVIKGVIMAETGNNK
jgi:hypothetical protein